jgi:hypothetical protein
MPPSHELMLKSAKTFSLLIALALSVSCSSQTGRAGFVDQKNIPAPFSTPHQWSRTNKKPLCINSGSLTEANSKGGDRSIWTNDTSSQDGLLSLTYCGVFKDGPTVVNRISNNDLTQIPTGFEPLTKHAQMVGETLRVRRLPLGYSVYKNMAFEIRTQAVPNEKYLTFRVPSVQTEEEFNSLAILYLDEDQLLPGALDWQSSWRELDIPKSDFKTRTLTSMFDFATAFHANTYIGRVVIATLIRRNTTNFLLTSMFAA